jgi:hypothetical protein
MTKDQLTTDANFPEDINPARAFEGMQVPGILVDDGTQPKDVGQGATDMMNVQPGVKEEVLFTYLIEVPPTSM